ncbi:hypothetical protein VA596_36220 [Amycolatopsis sp., V23-08]|uniref:Uncharacterized protein n=1 Tax=Amycolatopsis heterodermiae TaxID=3110235 RepID=A0ABU5RFG7_9PSEU|nr:hypothetical protein [Amycolatopsis sp., V23-08]MEA5365027.1 hypothetical protein [Amycolatopsis sp., V23-08]
MLYRLHPPATVTWCAAPGGTLRLGPAGLDALAWAPAEELGFTDDLLRIALRHGVPSGTGLVLDVRHTLDLGRADALRRNQAVLDEARAELAESESMRVVEQLYPGSYEWGAQLDERARETIENVARKAEADLTEVLAAPVRPELAEHWRRLGGHDPD